MPSPCSRGSKVSPFLSSYMAFKIVKPSFFVVMFSEILVVRMSKVNSLVSGGVDSHIFFIILGALLY